MPKITAEEILDQVRIIVSTAYRGKRQTPAWVTAYNVLNRINSASYTRLVADHGESGKGAGSHHSSAQVVKQALLMLAKNEEVIVDYIDASNENWYDVHGTKIQPGNVTVGIYKFVG